MSSDEPATKAPEAPQHRPYRFFEDEHPDGKAQPPLLYRFLWFCAGADPEVLKRCPHSEWVKYQGLGGVVLATAALATMSSAYAFYTVFLPKADLALSPVQQTLNVPIIALSVTFGIVWGLVIFNLDRFVVSSAGKGDGKESISLGELATATPRMLLAVAIALTISKPLEIRVMESEIEAQLELEQQQYRSELDHETEERFAQRKGEVLGKIDEAMARLDERRDYFENRRREIQEQRRQLEAEIEGSAGTGLRGTGPAWAAKKQNLDDMEAELERDRQDETTRTTLLEQERDRYKAELAVLDQQLAENKEWNVRQSNNLDGLVKRIQIAHEISPLIGYALMALFVMIEIAPILFKLMLVRGPYDFLEIDAQLQSMVREGIEVDVKLITPEGQGSELRSAQYHRQLAEAATERKRIEAAQKLNEQDLAKRVEQIEREIASRPLDPPTNGAAAPTKPAAPAEPA